MWIIVFFACIFLKCNIINYNSKNYIDTNKILLFIYSKCLLDVDRIDCSLINNIKM